jgi:gas vesicle protein
MNNNTKRFAIGAVVAAAAGYVAGVLTAPKSGKETRKDIKNASVKARQEAEKKLKQLHSELDNLIEKAKLGAKKLKAGAAEDFASVITQAQIAKQKAREVLSALHEGDAVDKDLQTALKEVQQATDHLRKYLKKHPEVQS